VTPPRRSRRSPPFRFALRLQAAVAAWLLDWLLRLTAWTSRRIELRPEHDLDRLGETCVVVTLHQGLFHLMHQFRGRGGIVMASRSRDGEFVSAALRRLGNRVARGSDRRGGLRALDEMIEFVRSGRGSAALTCDGPRGPYGAVKLGVLKLARDTGRPLVPCAVWSNPSRRLSNWDRTLVPLPFSRVIVSWGRPIHVPRDAGWRELRRIREALAAEIESLVAEAREVATGRAPRLRESSPPPRVAPG
jgi:hypothetical protein